MLKIGVIGLGDIAQKAYLPVIGRRTVEVHICTRSPSVLRAVGDQYRISQRHSTLESIIDSGISGAFVHTSTPSHESIVEKLLANNLHVYVDKPLTDRGPSSAKLISMAKEKSLLLTVGFNRRFAPAYKRLREVANLNMVVFQKNRHNLSGDVRTFVFDDFIHVVDTLLFLFPYAVNRISVEGKKNGNALYHLTLQLHSKEGATAIGIMNRDSGTTEEKIEVYSSTEKWTVSQMTDTVVSKDQQQIHTSFGDWVDTLHKRGFEQRVDHFLNALTSPAPSAFQEDILPAHLLCEEIVSRLES